MIQSALHKYKPFFVKIILLECDNDEKQKNNVFLWCFGFYGFDENRVILCLF